MKINQLFIKHVDLDMLNLIIECFGLVGIGDRRLFSKSDMLTLGTAQRITSLVPQLTEYYLPCKARIYLNHITEKKSITILKQILKLHQHLLLSRERNSRHRKIILYQIVSDKERHAVQNIEVKHNMLVDINFD
jgi:hypothetical protein